MSDDVQVYAPVDFHDLIERSAAVLGMDPDAVSEIVLSSIEDAELPFILFQQDERVMIGSLIPDGFQVVMDLLIEKKRRRGRA